MANIHAGSLVYPCAGGGVKMDPKVRRLVLFVLVVAAMIQAVAIFRYRWPVTEWLGAW